MFGFEEELESTIKYLFPAAMLQSFEKSFVHRVRGQPRSRGPTGKSAPAERALELSTNPMTAAHDKHLVDRQASKTKKRRAKKTRQAQTAAEGGELGQGEV